MSPSSRSKASPGMPDEGIGRTDRVAELEARLERLESEGGPGLKERGRRLVDMVMPPEASHHFFNAGREQLLGMRSIVDFWLRRLDDLEKRAEDGSGRTTIEID